MLAAESQRKPARPNVVIFLADDLGYADLACYGADFHRTPHLDRLASRAVRFTDGYASAPVCTPTRAALMTGKFPARLGMTIWAEAAEDPPPLKYKPLIPATSEHNLSHDETTVASYLQRVGYRTALVGKWHLGDARHYPETHGFDVNIGGTLWGAPHTFFYPYRGKGLYGSEYRYVPHLENGKPGEYLTDRLTDEAIRFIEHSGGEPFFLYLAHHAPHTPIEAKPEDVSLFEARVEPSAHHRNPTYAAMVKSLDESVGRVLKCLDDRGLAERTLVIVTSDNGGYIGMDNNRRQPCTDNSPLRSGKGALYEGGIRVPLIVRAPAGKVTGGVCSEPVMTTDLFFTVLAAAGIAPAGDGPRDGIDLSPLLSNPRAKLDREALYFHYPHYYATTSPVSAVRTRDWKLIEFLEDDRRELYNLANDLGEQRNLADEQPQRAKELTEQLHHWRDSVGARMPQPNPDYKPPKNRR